jgi:hypothetical protein
MVLVATSAEWLFGRFVRHDFENVRLSDFDQDYPRIKATALLETQTIVKRTV